ncbi:MULTISPECIES: hypothetical protein [unclassified Virgibacillus]|uniref:hypothetical protein n=1 Tax=unclassified Virgibacillus TaxID=2620237 RepID=UPI0024DE27EF|nr:hypothetical protein [Virgibacillus sp. LDC-1]
MCSLIAIQPYVKIHREVNSVEQKHVEEHRVIHLYEDRIETEHRAFSVDDVWDVSYREFGWENGLLYLHTSKGVFSYQVKESPHSFIEAFQQNIKSQ